MKINITDTFTESLEKLINHETWWYKTYSFIRWDITRFFKNIWRFRRELKSHSWWDYRFTLEMLYRSISIMEKGMHNGIEVRESRDKKIQKMQRVLELLKNKIDDNYCELAEKELGIPYIFHGFEFKELDETESKGSKLYELVDNLSEEDKENNRKIMKLSREIEDSQWNEIWEIFKGQDIKEYSSHKINSDGDNSNNKEETDWNDWFDGTGLRGWWD
jgi:hypothetical protein